MKYTCVLKYVMAGILLLAVLPMPLWYFSFVKVFIMLAFLVLTVVNMRVERYASAMVCLALAVLFQPFFAMGLGKAVWRIVDLAVAAALAWGAYLSMRGSGDAGSED